MITKEVFEAYEEHARAVDAEFRRVYDRFAERMQCRSGCSMCCSQMFSISMIEAAYISRAVEAMGKTERERLRAAAREYIEQARKITGGGRDEEQSFTPRPGLRLACPALKDDACSIYNARPLICRKWGIPLFNPGKPAELQACELNFGPGEEVDIEGLIEPQVELLEQWVELKGRAQAATGNHKSATTIADAILSDFNSDE